MVFSLLSETLLAKKYKYTEIKGWGELPALQKDNQTIYSLKPNLKLRLEYNNYNYILKTNSLGLTSPERDYSHKDSNEYRIFTLGDAFTMPEGLEYEDSYSYILEKKLQKKNRKKKISVIDGGVTGYGPIESNSRLKKLGSIIKPNLVIYEFFINEFEEVNLTAYKRLCDIGLETNFHKILYRLYSPVYLNSIIHFEDNDKIKEAKEISWYRSYYYQNFASYDSSTLKKLEFYLKTMQDYCKSIHSDFILLFVPDKLAILEHTSKNYTDGQLSLPYTHIKDICDHVHIKILNTTEALIKYNPQPVYFHKSIHWNKNGHLAVGNFLFNKIQANLLTK